MNIFIFISIFKPLGTALEVKTTNLLVGYKREIVVETIGLRHKGKFNMQAGVALCNT